MTVVSFQALILNVQCVNRFSTIYHILINTILPVEAAKRTSIPNELAGFKQHIAQQPQTRNKLIHNKRLLHPVHLTSSMSTLCYTFAFFTKPPHLPYHKNVNVTSECYKMVWMLDIFSRFCCSFKPKLNKEKQKENLRNVCSKYISHGGQTWWVITTGRER